MTLSMTAYAQASDRTPWGELVFELRTVNHRYLEISPRMPDELRALEPVLRERIAARLKRGRVDCFVRLRTARAANEPLELNQDVVAQLHGLAGQLADSFTNLQTLRAIDVLQWPGVVRSPDMELESLREHLLKVVDDALDALLEVRRREGGKLADLIRQRLAAINDIVAGVRELLPEIEQAYRQRLDERLAEIVDQLDPARVEQEIVLFLQKSDVAEELDRLMVHTDEVGSVLKAKGAIGRKLDFLMQELNREANTLGSKSHDPRLTQASVELKVLIEQMREQVQNIE